MNLPKISTLRVLELARERITDVRNWTIGVRWGENAPDGVPTNCALGAIEYAYGFRFWASIDFCRIDESEPVKVLGKAAIQLEPTMLIDIYQASTRAALLNNQCGHQRTLEMFDLAIANEKAKIEREGQKLIETLENEHDSVELLASR